MAYEVNRGGTVDTISYGRAEMDKLVSEREKIRAAINSMESVKADQWNQSASGYQESKSKVESSQSQLASYQASMTDIEKKIEDLINKSKTMDEILKRPGAKDTTTSMGSALVGGSTQQSVLTSIL